MGQLGPIFLSHFGEEFDMRSAVRHALMIGSVTAALAAAAAVAQTPTPPPPPSPESAARQELMRSNSGVNAVVNPIVRGEQPWNQQVAVQQADILASNGMKLPSLFPAGSGPEKGRTRALPVIWQNAADFEVKLKAFADETARLLQLARANDEAGFKAQFPRVGQACGACHTAYRGP
jgi:cytochrome c556